MSHDRIEFENQPRLMAFLETHVADLICQGLLPDGCRVVLDRAYPPTQEDMEEGHLWPTLILRVWDLIRRPEHEIAQTGISWTAARAIQRLLKSWDLTLGMTNRAVDNWLLHHVIFKGQFNAPVDTARWTEVAELHRQVDWIIGPHGAHNIRHKTVLRSVVNALNGTYLLKPEDRLPRE